MQHIAFTTGTGQKITTTQLCDIAPGEIVAHMSDPRMAQHMPLLTFAWDHDRAQKFIAQKREHWDRDGLGHWAFLCNGSYAGWGGFQREGEEWDFGLVLKPDYFGLGLPIARSAIAFARADPRIDYITFLLPPSRRHVGGMRRLGARLVGEVSCQNAVFGKYRLDL